MADGRVYILQPSFASGEISPDVASRVDLDKYQNALLQAKNAFIRPYGSVYRRQGTFFIDDIKPGYTRLQEFAVDADSSYLLVFKEANIAVYKDGEKVANVSTPFAGWELQNLRFAQSADVMFIASGRIPVQVLTRYSDTTWTLAPYEAEPPYFDALTMTEGVTITPSATTGTVTLTASGSVFSSNQVGNTIQLRQDMASATVSQSSTGTSSAILAGRKGWKVISHGTWAGSFDVEYSTDGTNWKILRSYSSNKDNNISESGTFDKPTWIRAKVTLNDGDIAVDLTRLPYTHTGTVKLTGYTSGTVMTGTVKDDLADTSAADDWAFGAWSGAYGYPSCVTFFQDRLCFAASNKYPYMVWMSRTGDYFNFGTEEADGTLTDDSAVALSFISRRDFRIKHLVATADLVVMTEGNEWVISGGQTVTPTSVTPQVQTSRGCTDVEPILVGGQMIYVQRHGKTVRDMQYNYASDSYDGADLTILAKHITKNTEIVDAAYRQEPDYMTFFVLDNGECACLTYINEQKVFAWSRLVTNGKIKSVETVNGPYGESVYFVIERGTEQYLEVFSDMQDVEDPNAYCMLDCANEGYMADEPSKTISLPWLANQTVDVLADGRHIEDITLDENGEAELEVPCYYYIAGLKYETVIELPNIEIQLRDGTLQGRKKKVSSVILRLSNSLGGRVGINEDKTDIIKYDESLAQEVTLYSGEKNVTVPNVTTGGFNDWGRVVVTSDMPYPLSIASIVRAVVPGG